MIDKNDIIYTFKTSYHISYNQEYFCCAGSNVNLYDSKDGKLVSTFKNIKHSCYSEFTSDQRLIVKTTTGRYHIYDLESMTLDRIIPPPKNTRGTSTDFQITSDNKYIIDFSYVFPNYSLMIIEIETGTYTFFDLGYARGCDVFQTETESKYYVVAICAKTIDAPDVSVQDFYELSYIAGRFELKKLFTKKYNKVAKIDYVSGEFAISNYIGNIRIFGIQKHRQKHLDHSNEGVLYDMKLSKNGQFLALAESRSIYVYDISKKKCIKAYEVDYGCFVDFIDNDTKLLIGTWEKGYCVSWQ